MFFFFHFFFYFRTRDISASTNGIKLITDTEMIMMMEEMERRRFVEAEQEKAKARDNEEEESRKLLNERREAEQRELERQRQEQEQQEQQRREAERRELELRRFEAEQRELEQRRFEAEQRELERRRLEAERIEAERIEAERIEAVRMEAELNRQRSKMRASSSYIGQHHRTPASTDPVVEHLLGQSITVNTKEAMSVVQDLWHSPEQSIAGRGVVVPIQPTAMGHSMPPHGRGKLSFDIHMDSSMTQQHAITGNKQHHQQQYNIHTYGEQENHQHYPSAYASPEQHQSPYGNHGYHNAYHYQIQVSYFNRVSILLFLNSICFFFPF